MQKMEYGGQNYNNISEPDRESWGLGDDALHDQKPCRGGSVDQVTYNDQQNNDHGGDQADKQRKDDDGLNNEELMMITVQESLPLLNFGSNQQPFVSSIQNFFVKFLLARSPPNH